MKQLLQIRTHHLPHLSFLFLLGATLLLSACSKDAKSTAGSNTASTTALAHPESLTSLTSAGIDTGGLVAWYNFNGGAFDVSRYNNKIVFNNAEPATDRNGKANFAYHFNGTSSFMRVKNSPSLNLGAEVTLFAIVKFDDFYAGACHGNRVFFKGTADFESGAYGLGADDGYTYNGGQNCYQDVDKTRESFQSSFNTAGLYDPTQFVETGRWYHLVYTFGKGVANFYVDGKLVNNRQMHIIPATNNDDLFIGRLANDGYPYWLNGSIDQIGIFNRTLNENQIARLSSY